MSSWSNEEESELQAHLQEAHLADRVLVQSFINAASMLGENALCLRALLPGAPPPPKLNIGPAGAADGITKKRKAKATDDDGGEKKKKKRRKSGYLLFSTLERPKVIADSGDTLKPPEIMKALGTRWKALPTEEQESYKERAANGEGSSDADDDADADADAVANAGADAGANASADAGAAAAGAADDGGSDDDDSDGSDGEEAAPAPAPPPPPSASKPKTSKKA